VPLRPPEYYPFEDGVKKNIDSIKKLLEAK
jgi:hypothetical protein